MSEQISQPENTGPDITTPANAAMPDQTRGNKPGRDGFAHISITQLTLAVLVIIFLWQWLDGHRAISDMQQQLAKKIAEMDGNSKANQVLLAQDQDQVRELSAKVATNGIALCRVAKPARRTGEPVQQSFGEQR